MKVPSKNAGDTAGNGWERSCTGNGTYFETRPPSGALYLRRKLAGVTGRQRRDVVTVRTALEEGDLPNNGVHPMADGKRSHGKYLRAKAGAGSCMGGVLGTLVAIAAAPANLVRRP